MAFKTDELLQLIMDAQTIDWPGGLAHLIVAGLFREFKPQDQTALV